LDSGKNEPKKRECVPIPGGAFKRILEIQMVIDDSRRDLSNFVAGALSALGLSGPYEIDFEKQEFAPKEKGDDRKGDDERDVLDDDGCGRGNRVDDPE